PILLLIGLGAAAYLALGRRAGRAPLRLGPSGPWWGAKLVVGIVITVGALVALILGVISYNHSIANSGAPVAPNDEESVCSHLASAKGLVNAGTTIDVEIAPTIASEL